MPLSRLDIEELRTAKRLLEHPGLAAKLSDYVGAPMQQGFALLPKRWHAAVNAATRKSIATALDVALLTMDHGRAQTPSNRWHKLAVGGAVINTLFIDHFQDMGKGHFIVRRLERAHGAEEVKRIYLEL